MHGPMMIIIDNTFLVSYVVLDVDRTKSWIATIIRQGTGKSRSAGVPRVPRRVRQRDTMG